MVEFVGDGGIHKALVLRSGTSIEKLTFSLKGNADERRGRENWWRSLGSSSQTAGTAFELNWERRLEATLEKGIMKIRVVGHGKVGKCMWV